MTMLVKCTFREMDFKKEQMLAVVVFKLLHYITKDWSKNRGAIFSLVASYLCVLGFTVSKTHKSPI